MPFFSIHKIYLFPSFYFFYFLKKPLVPRYCRTVVVVGHEHCGGALTALREAGNPPPEDQVERQHTLYDSLYHFVESFRGGQPNDVHDKDSKDPNDAITRWLTPLVDRVKELALPQEEEAALRVVIEENVKLQVANIVRLGGWVHSNAVKKPIWVHGWVYDFSTGFIRDLEITEKL